jgi:hypothetical protein
MGAATAGEEASGIALRDADLCLGEPLPWDVYDSHGGLLLRRGSVIHSARQREVLLERGLHRKDVPEEDSVAAPPAPRPRNLSTPTCCIFELVEALLERLRGAFSVLLAGRADAPARIEQIASDLQAICERAADPLLAALHVNQEGPYSLLHPLHSALLCEVVLRRLELPPPARLPLVAAALSHDVGMLGIQEALQHQVTPLSEAQWADVRKHPRQGAEVLARAGVADPVWLDGVLYHHERVDGSGYPEGLRGDGLSLEARLVAIADIYSAMVRPRVYRDALVARAALREIFLERGQKIDGGLAEIFIKEVGVYPPGALVRLASGEVAVVAGRGEDGSHPPVFGLISSDGKVAPRAVERDTREPDHAIAEMLPHRKFRALTGVLRRLWPAVPVAGGF